MYFHFHGFIASKLQLVIFIFIITDFRLRTNFNVHHNSFQFETFLSTLYFSIERKRFFDTKFNKKISFFGLYLLMLKFDLKNFDVSFGDSTTLYSNCKSISLLAVVNKVNMQIFPD